MFEYYPDFPIDKHVPLSQIDTSFVIALLYFSTDSYFGRDHALSNKKRLKFQLLLFHIQQ